MSIVDRTFAKWTRDEERKLEEIYPSHTYSAMSQILGRPPEAIRRKVSTLRKQYPESLFSERKADNNRDDWADINEEEIYRRAKEIREQRPDVTANWICNELADRGWYRYRMKSH